MASPHKKIIAIDAQSGDKGPRAVFGGLNQFLYKNPDTDILFRVFGRERELRLLLQKYPRVARNCELIDAPDVIKMTDKIMDVIRHSQNTSMYRAIRDVREGNASAVISAGNTGMLMSIAKLSLSTIAGISRPAITTMLPAGAADKRVVVLDLGANVHNDEENLFDFAVMGAAYAEYIGGMPKPKLGILNIGSEDQKGAEYLQRLHKLFNAHKKDLPFNYIGFIEGTDISGGVVQVVVTDGFTGNIVLKTIEGTAKLVKRVVVDTFKKSIVAIIAAFFLIHVFKRLKNKIDPRSYAGAIFIGLNGFVVKTHGSSDALAFANSIEYTVNMVEQDFNSKIERDVKKMSRIKKKLSVSE